MAEGAITMTEHTTAASDNAPVSSRERGTLPCSRAFLRRWGVAFSDLLPLLSAMRSPLCQVEKSVSQADGLDEEVFEQTGPVLQRGNQDEHAENAFDRGSHHHERELR